MKREEAAEQKEKEEKEKKRMFLFNFYLNDTIKLSRVFSNFENELNKDRNPPEWLNDVRREGQLCDGEGVALEEGGGGGRERGKDKSAHVVSTATATAQASKQ